LILVVAGKLERVLKRGFGFDVFAGPIRIMRLRPVSFRYIAAQPAAPLEYGLIAEEVAEVFPEAVVYNSKGQIETVQYHKINAMLLNEVQKQHRQLGEQGKRLADLEELVRRLTSPPSQ